MQNRPIIVIGMHRSGTSMLTRRLEELGVYVGGRRYVGTNHEAIFFKRINKWILSQLGASWDRPESAALRDERVIGEIERVMRGHVRGPRISGYLGLRTALRVRGLEGLRQPWGWKDPLNSLVVDLWKRVFPAARILHIHRHPLDVAASLQRREEKRLAAAVPDMAQRLRERWLVRRPLYGRAPRVLDRAEGVRLWQHYVSRCFEQADAFPGDAMHCAFEAITADPEARLAEIADFAGLAPDSATLAASADRVNHERRLAHRRAPEGRDAMCFEPTPLMQRLGYGAGLALPS